MSQQVTTTVKTHIDHELVPTRPDWDRRRAHRLAIGITASEQDAAPSLVRKRLRG